jgi:hypothetical protein
LDTPQDWPSNDNHRAQAKNMQAPVQRRFLAKGSKHKF